MNNVGMKATETVLRLLKRTLLISLFAFFFILVSVPTIDLSVRSLLRVEDLPEANESMIVSSETGQESAEEAAYQDGQEIKGELYEIYERVLATTSDISLPMLGVVIPIIALVVPLCEVLAHEKQKQYTKIHTLMRSLFRTGSQVEIRNDLQSVMLQEKNSSPMRMTTRESMTPPYIVSFNFSVPSSMELPGRGFRAKALSVKFFNSMNDYAPDDYGTTYSLDRETECFSPEMKLSIAVSDEQQSQCAKQLIYSHSAEEKCAARIRLVVDDWQNVEYTCLIALRIGKQRIGNNADDTLVHLIEEVTSIEIIEKVKRRIR